MMREDITMQTSRKVEVALIILHRVTSEQECINEEIR